MSDRRESPSSMLLIPNRFRFGLSVIFGLLLSYSFLNYHAFPLVWIAYVPMLIAVHTANLRVVLLCSFLGGMVLFASGNYWILDFIKISKGIAGTKALIMAISVWIYCAILITLQITLYEYLRRTTRLPEVILFPVIISSTLQLYPMMFELHLADSQVFFPLILQLLPTIGIWGVDAIIALVNVTLFIIFKDSNNRENTNESDIDLSLSVAPSLLVMVVFLALSLYAKTSRKDLTSELNVNIGIIQPNQKPALGKQARPQGYALGYPPEMELTKDLANKGADMVIWPEGRHKHYLDNELIANAYQKQIGEMGISLLFQDFKNLTNKPNELRSNSAIFIDGNRPNSHQVYNKIKLIPLGETLPDFIEHLSLGTILKNVLGEFFAEIQPGNEFQHFQHPDFNIVPLICFETTDSGFVENAITEARKKSPNSPVLVVALSNDGWFGSRHQAQQHIYPSALRAIENQATLIHVSNNGPSLIAWSSGRIEILSQNDEFIAKIFEL